MDYFERQQSQKLLAELESIPEENFDYLTLREKYKHYNIYDLHLIIQGLEETLGSTIHDISTDAFFYAASKNGLIELTSKCSNLSKTFFTLMTMQDIFSEKFRKLDLEEI